LQGPDLKVCDSGTSAMTRPCTSTLSTARATRASSRVRVSVLRRRAGHVRLRVTILAPALPDVPELSPHREAAACSHAAEPLSSHRMLCAVPCCGSSAIASRTSRTATGSNCRWAARAARFALTACRRAARFVPKSWQPVTGAKRGSSSWRCRSDPDPGAVARPPHSACRLGRLWPECLPSRRLPCW
jgi:hypothetical protein